jgi:hypothetical protein
MYGLNVHKAVIDKGEIESGITIHKVNEKYNEGDIVAQVKVPVLFTPPLPGLEGSATDKLFVLSAADRRGVYTNNMLAHPQGW